MTDHERMRSLVTVGVADVYKHGRLAARLSRTSGTTTFAYDSSYLESPGPAVATTLPLTDEPVVTVAGAVPPFFAGLLPEGRRLTSLRRAVKTSADDDLSLLLAIGHDLVGDVQVVPKGEPVAQPEPLVSVEGTFSDVRFADLMAEAGVVDPVGLAGVQDKASARMISVPVAQAGTRYILKVDPPEFGHVVENEAYFARRARAARIPVVDTQVIHDRTGRPGLLVTRFDRVPGDNGATTALAVEDAAQVLGIYPADKYAVTAEKLTTALAAVCAAPSLASRDVFRQLCFAWLTGNGDVHAKNLSVVSTPTGEWRVAPAYDVPSTLPYHDHTMALSMSGRRDRLSRKALLAFAEQVGLPQRAAERALDSALAATRSVPDELEEQALPFAPSTIRTMVRSLRQRWQTAAA